MIHSRNVLLTLLVFPIFLSIPAFSQFPGAANTPGTAAMHKDSVAFVGWATACTVSRGYFDSANPGLGMVDFGTNADALGTPDGTAVVSLGDGGSAVLMFDYPIQNGDGVDFAVFENSFGDNFLELAFVEVSSDGINYVRFPATSFNQTDTQFGPFQMTSDPAKINNLAGKYRALYGTPFELQELSDSANLDINTITHIRIVDVVGNIQSPYASYDQFGTPINDPYPTPFSSGGFDLDAVGVIHQSPWSNITEITQPNNFSIYPNPCSITLHISDQQQTYQQARITTTSGEELFVTSATTINIETLPNGVYFLEIRSNSGEISIHRWVKK